MLHYKTSELCSVLFHNTGTIYVCMQGEVLIKTHVTTFDGVVVQLLNLECLSYTLWAVLVPHKYQFIYVYLEVFQ